MPTKICKVPANIFYSHSREIKDLIYKNAYRNRCLNRIVILFKKLVNKNRWVVELTFGSIKRWFVSGKTRYKGLACVHA
ncbi:MAG: transposase [Flavobacteriales bacterium Tduv]